MRYEQTPIWSPRDGEDASRSPPRARPGKMLEEKDESAKLQSVYWAAHRMRSWGTQPRASDSLQSEEGINKIRQVAQAICRDEELSRATTHPPLFSAVTALAEPEAPLRDFRTSECVLCQLAKLERQPAVHITFHPPDRDHHGFSSDGVFSFLDSCGIECSVPSVFEGHDR